MSGDTAEGQRERIDRARKTLEAARAVKLNELDVTDLREHFIGLEGALASALPVLERLRAELAEAKADLDQVSVHKGVNCYWRSRAHQAEAERDALKAARERVRALHRSSGDPTGEFCGECDYRWPCPTNVALDAPVKTAQEVQRGDTVRHRSMATEANGEWLRDCKVTKSGRTGMGSWLIEWHMVGDETVSGSLLCQPDTPVEIVMDAPETSGGES